ncbi:MAG TPA: hypothetical protein VHL11_24180, partial [Phototrophicaceae bacterium]|nr:hypothetical protein [Phototrophicaceae bacterium]
MITRWRKAASPVSVVITLMILIITASILTAQQQDIVVPDLTGMNAPQAGAELNRVGLKLGNQID